MKQPVEFVMIINELRKEDLLIANWPFTLQESASLYILHRKVTMDSQPFRLISPVSPENVSAFV